MTKVLMCDPPSGWKYGFPKPYTFVYPEQNNSPPFETMERQWWLDNGYPQFEIDRGMLKYVRFWEDDSENWR